jgi:hypothetical protein
VQLHELEWVPSLNLNGRPRERAFVEGSSIMVYRYRHDDGHGYSIFLEAIQVANLVDALTAQCLINYYLGR